MINQNVSVKERRLKVPGQSQAIQTKQTKRARENTINKSVEDAGKQIYNLIQKKQTNFGIKYRKRKHTIEKVNG